MDDPEMGRGIRNPSPPRTLPVLITVVVGTSLSILLFLWARTWEQERIQLDFERHAGDLAVAIEQRIDESIEVLQSIRTFYEVTPKIDRRQFHGFVKRLLSRHPSIQALEWIPRVSDVERRRYEAEARRDGYLTFQFTERKSQGQMIRARPRAEYFPVYYVEPFQGNEIALGFDLASNAARLSALTQARDADLPVATSRIVLVQETGEQYGFLVFLPIYRPGTAPETVEARRENLLGFALGVYRIGNLVEAALRNFETGNVTISVQDESAAPDARLLYRRLPAGRELETHGGGEAPATGVRRPQWQRIFEVAGRRWALTFEAPSPALAVPKTWPPWGALGAGFVLTAVLAAYLRLGIDRASRLARARQLEALRSVTTEISRELDLAPLMQLTIRRAAELVGAVSGAVFLWDEGEQGLSPRAWYGYGDWMRGVRIKLGEGVTGTVAERRQGLVVNDYRASPNASPLFLARTGITATLAEPLLCGDQLVGVITINHEGNGRLFTEEDRELLALFGGQAAIAIENARLHAAAVRRGEELEALLRAIRSVMSGLDLQGILDRILAEAAQISGCSHVKVLLVDREAGVLRAAAVQGTSMPLGYQWPVGTDRSSRVATTGEPYFHADSPHDPSNPFAEKDRELGVVTYLGLPIKSRDEVIGVLTFNTTAPRRYTPNEVAYLTSFADQAAIAIENARLYDTIQQHAHDLEARVRERTADLEEALRAKVEFLGKMSHELRTPLNFVIGFSELLQQGAGGPLTAKQGAYVNRVLAGGRRLLGLVNDVLDMAQLDARRNALRLEPVLLGPLVQEVLRLMQIQMGQKRLKLTTTLDPWTPLIIADRFKLAHILHILLDNAVKFTPEQGSIRITSRQVAATWDRSPHPEGSVQSLAPDKSVELIVEDTGIGIRPENLDTIFEPFYQVDGSETRAYGGAGLGLALVRKLVELHGGQVWAESSGPGQGSRFIVRLPRLEVPKAKRILLVEDDPLVRAPMATALEGAGFAVVGAATGTEAATLLEAGSYDLLILDVTLPDMDGWKLLQRVREAEDIRTLPVLMVTALESVNAEQAIGRGADEFLTKPVSPRVLVETVTRLLAQAGTQGAAVGPGARGGEGNPGT